jgi:class 3 adenylate cyclase/tetratricopeptide (TPR) repeat protein
MRCAEALSFRASMRADRLVSNESRHRTTESAPDARVASKAPGRLPRGGSWQVSPTVTVATLFTDLVDSTAVSTRLGPESAEVQRRSHYELLRSAIGAWGGTEVKSTGDGLMAVFPSASAAVSAAVAVQQGVERANREAPEPLTVRVGVSVGEAEPAEGDYYGTSVVEGARLCAAAVGGQILATEMVRAMAGGRGGHAFESVGALELKGLEGAVPTCEVVWAPAAPDVVPLPRRLTTDDAPGFFGREEERALLGAAFKAAEAGERHVVLISGEPGIGKTRLMAEAATAAHAAGGVVLYGRSDEDVSLPYQPFVEALRHYVEFGPETVLRAHVEQRGGELTRLVPELAERLDGVPAPQSTDPEGERYLLFGAVVGLIDQASRGAPVVLVLDDVHWSDKPSLLLLRHLIVSSDGLPLLIVVAYREAELARDHPLVDLLAALHRESGVQRVTLEGLGNTELQALLAARAGHDLDEDGVAFAQLLRQETAGNPFFVAELVRHLAETGAITQDAGGRWTVAADLGAMGLPQSLREVIGARVARLGDTAVRALTLAAVIGREFDLVLLARVGEFAEDELLDTLDAARRMGLVDDVAGLPDHFTFAHGLIEHTLYEDLAPPRRQRAHLRVAEALEELSPVSGRQVGELAYHWSRAAVATNAGKAIGYARQAGDDALARLAPDDAIRWYRQALELLEQHAAPGDGLRCDLLIDLAEAQHQAGEPGQTATAGEAVTLAQGLGSGSRLVRAVLVTERVPEVGGGSFLSPERRQELLDAIGSALAVTDADDPDRARLLGMLATVSDSFPRRRAVAEEAVALARRAEDDATLAYTLTHAVAAVMAPETLELRLQWGTEAHDLAAAAGDLVVLAQACNAHSDALAERGDFATRESLIVEAEQIAERLPMPDVQQWPMSLRAWDLLAAGRLDELDDRIHQGRSDSERFGYPYGFIVWGVLEFARQRQAGDLDAIGGVVDALAGQLAQQLGAAHQGLLAVSALVSCDRGREQEAQPLLERQLATGFADVPYDQSWLSTLDMWAAVAATLGSQPAAQLLYERLLPWQEHIVYMGNGAGRVSYYLGLLATTLGHHDEAERHLAEALAIHDRLGFAFLATQTRLGLARLLLERSQPGDRARAEVLAEEGLQTAKKHGFRVLEQRSAELRDAAAKGHE